MINLQAGVPWRGLGDQEGYLGAQPLYIILAGLICSLHGRVDLATMVLYIFYGNNICLVYNFIRIFEKIRPV